jgi:hypothetical protein
MPLGGARRGAIAASAAAWLSPKRCRRPAESPGSSGSRGSVGPRASGGRTHARACPRRGARAGRGASRTRPVCRWRGRGPGRFSPTPRQPRRGRAPNRRCGGRTRLPIDERCRGRSRRATRPTFRRDAEARVASDRAALPRRASPQVATAPRPRRPRRAPRRSPHGTSPRPRRGRRFHPSPGGGRHPPT